jgi:tetratricopeptide (TPR) repeat protein
MAQGTEIKALESAPTPEPHPVFGPRRKSPWPLIGLLLFIASAVILLPPILWRQPGGDWRDLKIQGNALAAAGDYRGAERLDREALTETDKLGPRGWEAGMVLFNLAQNLRTEGRHASAEHAMEKSLAAYRADSYSPPAEVYRTATELAKWYTQDGKYDEAIPVLQEALALGKSLPVTESRGAYADLDDLAIAYRGAHRPHEAQAAFTSAVALAPTDFARDRIIAQWHSR